MMDLYNVYYNDFDIYFQHKPDVDNEGGKDKVADDKNKIEENNFENPDKGKGNEEVGYF